MSSKIYLSLSLSLIILMTLSHTAYSSSVATSGKFSEIDGDPALRSASVLVTRSDGAIIYGKNIDTIRSIASITKLMTAMVVIDSGLDMNEMLTITKADRDLVKLTGSRLEYGAKLSRGNLLHLALMSSENRAAAALGRNFPGGVAVFVAAMNAKAATLDMRGSRFSDPVGLNAENVATASDLGKMLTAAYDYPLIRKATTTLRSEVRPYRGRGPLSYVNTNRLLKNASWEIELSKTGYINEAGRCLVMRANIEGETVSIVLLDSFGKLTPYGDSNRLRRWMLES
jgi:D-alanyl-D-alanine endopeptidase (penicillin-binding protein 7)